jgi:hypothetical protein
MTIGVLNLEARMDHCNQAEEIPPFNELMFSWNAKRPSDGKYLFYVRVKLDEWSPWLLYASWGSDGQIGYLNTTTDAPVRVYQDAVEVLEEKKATGFQIKVVPEGTASVGDVYSLHVYTNSDQLQEPQQMHGDASAICLPLKGLSQITLDHARHMDLCSPTSTAAVVRYLTEGKAVDPLQFAQSAWDGGFDIYGNWVFNVAQASAELGPTWSCWVERLHGFGNIYTRLQQGTPVVVSVRGPLTGSALPYAKGHLLVVIGYDPLQQKVICMDPAFSSDDQTQVSYDFSEFIQAWCRRGRVAYIFKHNES